VTNCTVHCGRYAAGSNERGRRGRGKNRASDDRDESDESD